MAGARMRRIDEALREVVAAAVSELADPRLGFVTVTGVETSSDLRSARVYVSVLGNEPTRAASLEGLRSAHGYLQARMGSELTLRHTPTLTFEYDDTVDRAARITELLGRPGDD